MCLTPLRCLTPLADGTDEADNTDNICANSFIRVICEKFLNHLFIIMKNETETGIRL